MYIIGLNAYHPDSSACIIKNGRLISAAEEERFNRIKHYSGFPINALKFCLKSCDINLSNVSYIAINRNPSANNFRRLLYLFTHKTQLKQLINKFKTRSKFQNISNILFKEFKEDKFLGKIINIEHHLAHLSSCYHVSPFNESCLISVDGFGDFVSTTWGYGVDNKINIDKKIYFPNSLGTFYETITQFLGFTNYGDEYKVMGLAPYGKPKYLNQLREILKIKKNGEFQLNLKYFQFHQSNFNMSWNSGVPKNNQLFSNQLIELLGNPRKENQEITQYHKDLANSTQKIYEEAFLNILNNLYEKYKCENLSIAGGCGMNSVANGKVKRLTKFKNIYIQPAAGDAGGAIGSAYSTYFRKTNKTKNFVMKHAYWGSSFNNNYIKNLLDNCQDISDKCFIVENITNNLELCKKISKLISLGNIIGWFQGKMEWGPRALGNRSILGDPRNKDMKDILNSKIKRRESFRPFAPSILIENVNEWFETIDEVPFMMKVYQIIESKRKIIPAVTHVDGSGRLQTVKKDTNELYYCLIKEFYNITNVPILLNTSFNENEPIVCKPDEALNCFLRTNMDVLVLENYVISRK